MGPAFVPTLIRNFGEFEEIFGKENQDFYVPFTAKQYLRSAGAVTIVRVLGLGGYANDTVSLGLKGDNGHFVVATLKPSRGATDPDNLEIAGPGSASLSTSHNLKNAFRIDVNGTAYTASFDTSSADYIGKVFSEDPQDANKEVYLYSNFQAQQNATSSAAQVTIASGSDENFSTDYSVACTPSIQSQLVNSARTSLFKVKTRSHGTDMNSKYRVGISDVKRPADVPGSDYGSFTLQVIVNNPGETDDGTILETFSNLSFDEESTNYLPRVIGDRYVTIDSNGKLTYNGDWPNKSVHIYVSDYATQLEGIDESLLPHGYAAVSNPVLGTTTIPSASFVTAQTNTLGVFDQNVYYGFKFAAADNKQYLAPLPASAGTGNNAVFSLENQLGHNDASTLGVTPYADGTENLSLSAAAKAQLKFVVPFQDGFDGDDPTTLKAVGNDISAPAPEAPIC